MNGGCHSSDVWYDTRMNDTTYHHIASTFIPSLSGVYLTCEDIGTIDLEGRPSLTWSLSVQDGTGAILRRSPLDSDMAEVIYRSLLESVGVDPEYRKAQWQDFVADCRRWADEGRRSRKVGDLYEYTENSP